MSLRLRFVVTGSPNEPPSASAYALVVMAACSRLITTNASEARWVPDLRQTSDNPPRRGLCWLITPRSTTARRRLALTGRSCGTTATVTWRLLASESGGHGSATNPADLKDDCEHDSHFEDCGRCRSERPPPWPACSSTTAYNGRMPWPPLGPASSCLPGRRDPPVRAPRPRPTPFSNHRLVQRRLRQQGQDRVQRHGLRRRGQELQCRPRRLRRLRLGPLHGRARDRPRSLQEQRAWDLPMVVGPVAFSYNRQRA